MESPPLVIRWAESESPRYHWYIRGLRTDGSFYGEVRSTFDTPRESDGVAGVARSIDGQITAAEMKRVSELVAIIRTDPGTDTDRPVVGVLADGPTNRPSVFYRHAVPPDESRIASAFLEIISILRPHLSVHYRSLA